MSIAVERSISKPRLTALRSPLTGLALAMVGVLLLLALPISLPIGPMYWDGYIYYDGAQRIFQGQAPIIDYFAPVGPLGYYLFAGWLLVFPNAQMTLITHWSFLAITAPLMAMVIADVDARSRLTAWALLIPFLVFTLLPFNGREFYPFPSSDGFGIYNRHVCHLLYVLVAALIYVRNQRTLTVLVTIIMAALFFLKITGFVAAGIICFYAVLAGRISLRTGVVSALAFFGILALSELWNGMVSTYVADILALVRNNSGTLLSRIVQAISINIDIIAASVALGIALLFATRKQLKEQISALVTKPGQATFAKLLNRDELWLATALLAGVIFEAQNTGSQSFMFLWPILWAILVKVPNHMARPKMALTLAALTATVFLPMLVGITQRAARTYLGTLNTVAVETHNLRGLASFRTRDNALNRANLMLDLYPKQQVQLAEVAAGGELPSALLYSDLDFQVTNLLSIDEAVDAIRAREAKEGVRYDTMMTFAFANLFPYLMDRSAPRLIAIGADPFRAVPPPTPEVLEAVAQVDLALYPKCPDTLANERLFKIYEPALKDHVKIALTSCYDAYVNPKLASAAPQS